YVIGPKANPPLVGMLPTLRIKQDATKTPSSDLTYTLPLSTNPAAAPAHAVLLRRLACPYMPFAANTNPYITVDYMANLPTRDGVANGTTGLRLPPPVLRVRQSLGRNEPYAAEAAQFQ